MNMDNIGSRIRAEREAQDISRSELAKCAGIAPTTLSNLELGLSKSSTALHKIARRLGVQADWLETGKGPKVAGDQSLAGVAEIETRPGMFASTFSKGAQGWGQA